MLKSRLFLFLIPVIFLTVAITVIVVLTSKKSPAKPDTLRPTPSALISPTPYALNPSPLPIPDFTGADAKQQLPEALKNIGEQKTALRRLTPLVLDFAVIEFDYENDMFLVQLFDPREQSLNQFTSWRTQTYPALTEDKFIIY